MPIDIGDHVMLRGPFVPWPYRLAERVKHASENDTIGIQTVPVWNGHIAAWMWSSFSAGMFGCAGRPRA